MNIWVRMYRWFFLDKFEWSPGEASVSPEDGLGLYHGELDILLTELRRQLPGTVSIRYLPDGKGVIEEDGEIVAIIAVFPKADGRRSSTYVVVDLKPAHIAQMAWFQFAFFGFKVRFRKPTLYPVKV